DQSTTAPPPDPVGRRGGQQVDQPRRRGVRWSFMDRYAGLPPLPDRLGRLRELALDLWWSWNPDARQVFRSRDHPLCRKTTHSAVRVLRTVPQTTLEKAAADARFVERYDRAIA